ncbi:MAG: N-acyl homoserine lactonase family protein [Sphingomonas sp.]|uniref:N-acyl homoserine lactonase family protein n=1 Tax=Sphingomonas sp. TaxID=28214 RepID=UPI0018314973|nr:N-acyl homoserine lactonase family protein [Sphingomonas sp.]MBA3667559.1 N-acyl homoserine lactonase family protein [Sphingomonas sp.]
MTWLLAAATLIGAAPAHAARAAPAHAAGAAKVSIVRLDCGTILVKDFNAFFSDSFDYKPGPRRITDSCYLVRHMNDYLLWDSGLPAALKGKTNDIGPVAASLAQTIVEQLGQLALKPADIKFIGMSHMHFDHTGQAAAFASAKLVIGKKDFELSKGEKDPFGPWRGAGAKVQTMDGQDVDVFGDGSVVALNMPGHTPGHMALLVRLASGPVLLTGDLYHSDEARAKKSIPPFNTSRADTLASIDRFERMAKNLGAKVIIQHEPADIAKLPAFPKAAE